jgi:uncharacterized protein
LNSADAGLLSAARMASRAGIQKWLDRGGSLHAVNRRGETALMLCYDVETLRWLVAQGVALEARDRNGETALLRAATWHYVQVVQVLVECGADPNTKRAGGETPLMAAAWPWPEDSVAAEAVEVLRLLLEGGADVNAADERGRTALMYLLDDEQHAEGHLPVARLLLEYGADACRVDAEGNTARSLSARRGFTDVAALLEQAGAAG